MPRSHSRLEDADGLRLRRQHAGVPEGTCHCIVHAAVRAAPAVAHVLESHQGAPPLATLHAGPQLLGQWDSATPGQDGSIMWMPVEMLGTPSACLWPNLEGKMRVFGTGKTNGFDEVQPTFEAGSPFL